MTTFGLASCVRGFRAMLGGGRSQKKPSKTHRNAENDNIRKLLLLASEYDENVVLIFLIYNLPLLLCCVVLSESYVFFFQKFVFDRKLPARQLT